MSITRLATALSAAMLTASVLAAPAHAATGWLCLIATAVQTDGEYTLSSPGCTGSGFRDVPVFVWSGPAAGNYLCRHVTFAPLEAEFDATGCVRT